MDPDQELDYINYLTNMANDDLPNIDPEYIIINIGKLSLLLLLREKKELDLWGLGKRAFALCFKGDFTRKIVHFFIANKVTTYKELCSVLNCSDQMVRHTIKEMLNAGFILELGTVDPLYGSKYRPARLFGFKSASEKEILAAKRRYSKIDTSTRMNVEKKEFLEFYVNKMVEHYIEASSKGHELPIHPMKISPRVHTIFPDLDTRYLQDVAYMTFKKLKLTSKTI